MPDDPALPMPEGFRIPQPSARRARLVAGFGVLLLLVLGWRIGFGAIASRVGAIGWRFGGIAGIYGLHEVVRAAALAECLPREGRPPFRDLLFIRFLGEAVRAVTLTGPLLAEPARAWLLKRQGMGAASAFAAAGAEYLANSLVSAALTAAAVVVLVAGSPVPIALERTAKALLVGVVGYLAAAGWILYRGTPVLTLAARGLGAAGLFGRKRAASLAPHVETFEGALLGVLGRRGVLLKVLAIEAAAHALLLLETYYAMRWMSIGSSAVQAFLAEVLTKLANVVLFVGAAEGAYALLFVTLGLPEAAGVALSLVKRSRSLVVAFLGLGGLWLLRSKFTKT